MSASPARELARRAVSRVRERNAFAHEVVDSLLASARLDPREAALATRLAYGTVQTRGTLDEAVARFLSHPKRIEPQVRDALAVSAYELLFARTPARATVSEGVELVRTVRPQASGLANAVLRKLADEVDAFPWGDPETDVAALARLHGHPAWLAELLVDELGRTTAAAVMAADNEPAPLFLAVNPFRATSAEAIEALTSAGADPQLCELNGCLVAGDASSAVRSNAVADGLVLVADGAAQLVPRLARPAPGQMIVDIGSGRGTKTLLLQAAAVAAGGPAHVVGVDLHDFKTNILAQRVRDLGVPDVIAITGDATAPIAAEGMPAAGTADAVLVDAPCSGMGTLRRHPEQRWRLTPEDIDSAAALGRRLLDEAANLVRPGGFMVYSTCTVTRRENLGVITEFLAGNEGFRLDDVGPDVPAAWQRFVTGEGAFQSLPEQGGPDGHFAVRLVRE